MRPVTSLQPSFDDRHGLADFVLGLWSVLAPLLEVAGPESAAARETEAAGGEPDETLALLLGLVSFAWHLEPIVRGADDVAAGERSSAPPALRELLR